MPPPRLIGLSPPSSYNLATARDKSTGCQERACRKLEIVTMKIREIRETLALIRRGLYQSVDSSSVDNCFSKITVSIIVLSCIEDICIIYIWLPPKFLTLYNLVIQLIFIYLL